MYISQRKKFLNIATQSKNEIRVQPRKNNSCGLEHVWFEYSNRCCVILSTYSFLVTKFMYISFQFQKQQIQLGWGGQPYCSFPFSKDSLVGLLTDRWNCKLTKWTSTKDDDPKTVKKNDSFWILLGISLFLMMARVRLMLLLLCFSKLGRFNVLAKMLIWVKRVNLFEVFQRLTNSPHDKFLWP